jgi:hypothetical protein
MNNFEVKLMNMDDDEYEAFLAESARYCVENGLPMAGEAMTQEMQVLEEQENKDCWKDEQGMQALEEAMWARYHAEEAIEPLCEGCHRSDATCICGGVPDSENPNWATEWEKHSLLDYRREEI